MLRKKSAGKICISLNCCRYDCRMFTIDVSVKWVAREEQAAITVIQVMQRVAMIQQQGHIAGFKQLDMKVAMRFFPYLLLLSRHAVASFDRSEQRLSFKHTVSPCLITVGDSLA